MKKVAASFGLFLVIVTPMMLASSEVQAQGAFCGRPYTFGWDWGYAPFASPFGYLDGPVDPYSAEWAPWDGFCFCWSGDAWAMGYDGSYSSLYWYTPWRYEGGRRKSKARGFDVAVLRPMPAVDHRGEPSLRRSSTDAPGRATRSNRGTSHRGTTWGQNISQAGYGTSPTYGGGGYSGQYSSSSSAGVSPSSGGSYSGKNR